MTSSDGLTEIRAIRTKLGSPRQIGSVRRVKLQDGPEQGLEAIVFSTAGQLQFWVLPGRGFDIGPVWYQGMPIAWEHPTGYSAAVMLDPESDRHSGIERLLSGFLVTCGLENARRPVQTKPQHGRLPSTPARLIGCGEFWDADTPYLYAEGEVVSAHLQNDCYRFRRRIEAPIDGSSLQITDVAENIGVSSLPLHLLYHFNVGYPFLTDETAVSLNGEPLAKPDATEPSVACSKVPDEDAPRQYLVEVSGGRGNRTTIGFETTTKDLPYLQTWRDPRPRRNILAIEPTNTDRAEDGTSIDAPMLEPGQTWETSLKIKFTSCA